MDYTKIRADLFSLHGQKVNEVLTLKAAIDLIDTGYVSDLVALADKVQKWKDAITVPELENLIVLKTPVAVEIVI